MTWPRAAGRVHRLCGKGSGLDPVQSQEIQVSGMWGQDLGPDTQDTQPTLDDMVFYHPCPQTPWCLRPREPGICFGCKSCPLNSGAAGAGWESLEGRGTRGLQLAAAFTTSAFPEAHIRIPLSPTLLPQRAQSSLGMMEKGSTGLLASNSSAVRKQSAAASVWPWACSTSPRPCQASWHVLCLSTASRSTF